MKIDGRRKNVDNSRYFNFLTKTRLYSGEAGTGATINNKLKDNYQE